MVELEGFMGRKDTMGLKPLLDLIATENDFSLDLMYSLFIALPVVQESLDLSHALQHSVLPHTLLVKVASSLWPSFLMEQVCLV